MAASIHCKHRKWPFSLRQPLVAEAGKTSLRTGQPGRPATVVNSGYPGLHPSQGRTLCFRTSTCTRPAEQPWQSNFSACDYPCTVHVADYQGEENQRGQHRSPEQTPSQRMANTKRAYWSEKLPRKKEQADNGQLDEKRTVFACLRVGFSFACLPPFVNQSLHRGKPRNNLVENAW